MLTHFPAHWRRIASAGALSLATLAQAQVFTYTTGDLVASFREAGKPSDVEVDLGSISRFDSLAGGTTLDLTDRIAPSLLNSVFGILDSVNFSVLGTERGGGGGYAANTSWLTLKRSDVTQQSAAPQLYTASKTAAIQSAISGIAGDGSVSGALQYAGHATYPPSTSTALLIPTSGVDSANSYTVKYGSVGGIASLVTSPGVENTTPVGFSSTVGGLVRSDLYEYVPGQAGVPAGSQPNATYLGYFTLNSDGSFSYTAVPEPGETAVATGAVLLVVAAWYRRVRR